MAKRQVLQLIFKAYHQNQVVETRTKAEKVVLVMGSQDGQQKDRGNEINFIIVLTCLKTLA